MNTFDSYDDKTERLSNCREGSIPEWLLDLADDRGFRLGNEVRRETDGTTRVRWLVYDRAVECSDELDGTCVTPADVRDYILGCSG